MEDMSPHTKYLINTPEEELKIKVGQDWFDEFDCSQRIKTLDFAVCLRRDPKETDLFQQAGCPLPDNYFLWAEAKKGVVSDILIPLAQLVITIGKEKLQDKYITPKYLAAFDAEKIAFVEYFKVADFYTQNDFNWNVTPSDHTTREFNQVLRRLAQQNGQDLIHFNWKDDALELRRFISSNFKSIADRTAKIRITKNNFIAIYAKWCKFVKPRIELDWELAKKAFKDGKDDGILDADFYLADILSANDKTLEEKLRVILKKTHYEMDRTLTELGYETYKNVSFKDNGKAHSSFWNVYERPPRREYWDYIINRRDLLVPQDVRETKGAFFTPACWVELSQQYIADALGEDWQDEYYVWDCCAGTGNLLAGLTEKHRLYASTLDNADVAVMKQRIKNGANLLEGNVFQFDFLNDPLDSPKIPNTLRDILKDPERRKKLVVYINPPYAEAATSRTVTGTGNNKPGTATGNETHKRYQSQIGKASNELFALFLVRVYKELQCCKLAQFATLKALCASNFASFREVFRAKLLKMFAVPGNTFDNVKGKFPIGFFVWDTGVEEKFKSIVADIYDRDGNQLPPKTIFDPQDLKLINNWYCKFYDRTEKPVVVGIMNTRGNDFQNQNYIRITTKDNHNHTNIITANNLIQSCIYLAVRQAIPSTWLNDRDQFLHPSSNLKHDIVFQHDCLIYSLFHHQNQITSTDGINHWIPFTEDDVGVKETFRSRFMIDFLNGKVSPPKRMVQPELSIVESVDSVNTFEKPIASLSSFAQDVYNAGRELWKYYHTQPRANPNASFYDIRAHFQGFDENGKMNVESDDQCYLELIAKLRSKMKILAKRIELKIYEHGFLRR